MRSLFFGLVGVVLFAAANGWMASTSKDKGSFLFVGFFGVIPADWLLIGIYMGMIIGLTHRGVRSADAPVVVFAGAIAGLLCTVATHFVQYLAYTGWWDFNGFLRYLAVYGEAWGLGSWYIWLATALATVTGGASAWALSLVQRTDNVRAQLSPWVSPSIRILIRVARADGEVNEIEANLILALLRSQLLRSLSAIPDDFEHVLSEVLQAEIGAMREGITLDNDLRDKALRTSDQRESTAKLAIALAQCDGEVSEAEANMLDKILRWWEIDISRRSQLAADAFSEVKRFA